MVSITQDEKNEILLGVIHKSVKGLDKMSDTCLRCGSQCSVEAYTWDYRQRSAPVGECTLHNDYPFGYWRKEWRIGTLLAREEGDDDMGGRFLKEYVKGVRVCNLYYDNMEDAMLHADLCYQCHLVMEDSDDWWLTVEGRGITTKRAGRANR